MLAEHIPRPTSLARACFAPSARTAVPCAFRSLRAATQPLSRLLRPDDIRHQEVLSSTLLGGYRANRPPRPPPRRTRPAAPVGSRVRHVRAVAPQPRQPPEALPQPPCMRACPTSAGPSPRRSLRSPPRLSLCVSRARAMDAIPLWLSLTAAVPPRPDPTTTGARTHTHARIPPRRSPLRPLAHAPTPRDAPALMRPRPSSAAPASCRCCSTPSLSLALALARAVVVPRRSPRPPPALPPPASPPPPLALSPRWVG